MSGDEKTQQQNIMLAVDIETSDLSGKEIFCVGFADATHAWSVEWDDHTTPALIEELQQKHTFVFHNAKFDVRVLREHGVRIPPGSYFDTLVMGYVHNPRRESYSLEAWGKELGLTKLIEDGVHSKEGWVWAEHTKSRIMRYCERDCVLTLKLFSHLFDKLKTDEKALKLLLDVELPFIECLIEMESSGFYLDIAASQRLLDELEQGQTELLTEMHKLIPFVPGKTIEYKRGYCKRNNETQYNRCELDTFNPNSSKHIIHALTKLYNWDPAKRTKTGQPCTDNATLEELDVPLASLLVEYSELAKMRGMVSGYLERVEEGRRRLFGNFNQTLTKTGRLSSSDPNLQNIPTNGKWGEKIRALFCSPDANWKMISSDLSNIEGRVLAHYLSLVCDEHRLAESFAAGADFHQANADAWGVSRKEAKTLLYAICYGAGPAKVGGGNKQRGLELMSLVDKNMPALKRLKELVWATARKRGGLIHTAFGRRLYYPEICEEYAEKEARKQKKGADVQQRTRELVAQAERRLFNALLQGTAADILKCIVLDVWRHNQSEHNAWLIANVHDEALYYVPAEAAESFCSVLEEAFRAPLLSRCEIKGEPKVGMNWHDIH